MSSDTDSTPRIVAIGASKSSLPALFELFDRIPANTGQAFAVAIHRSARTPDLHTGLAVHTRMTVRSVRNAERVRADHVYVAADGADLVFMQNHVSLAPASESSETPTAIDHLFRSLAEQCGSDGPGASEDERGACAGHDRAMICASHDCRLRSRDLSRSIMWMH